LKFNSLKTKIVVYFLGIFTLFLLLFSVAFYYYFNQDVNNKLKEKLSKEAILILKSNKTSKNVKIVNKLLKEKFIVQDLGENLKVTLIFPFDNKTIILTKIVDDKSEDVVDSMLVLEPILILILIFVTIKITDKLLKPIEEITNISKKISINNFNQKLSDNYQEIEIKNLINSFNDMIDRIQDGVKNLDRFNSDVSHELKTPLTIINGEIDVSLKKIRTSKDYINSMKIIKKETKIIKKIIDNLLLLTKYTKENIMQSFDKCYLDMILLEVLEKYEKSDKTFQVDIDNIEYFGNEQLIYHIFINLIDNAVKYSHTKIIIKLYKKDKIYFEVSDDGDGIEEKYLDKITNRFFRIDSSRNKKIQGFGLGLSIVKKAIELHNGELNITSNSTGTKIVVCL